MLRRLYERAKARWLLALRERATPAGIAWSIAVGVFVACTPFIGLHMWIAIGLATILRLNKVWAFVGSRFSAFPMSALLLFAEIQIGDVVRTGHGAPLRWQDAALAWRSWIGDLAIGFLPVAIAYSLVVGVVAYVLARAREKRRLTRTLARSPEPSSESPRSGSPDRPT